MVSDNCVNEVEKGTCLADSGRLLDSLPAKARERLTSRTNSKIRMLTDAKRGLYAVGTMSLAVITYDEKQELVQKHEEEIRKLRDELAQVVVNTLASILAEELENLGGA